MFDIFEIEVMKLLEAHRIKISSVLEEGEDDVEQIEQLAEVTRITSADTKAIIESLNNVNTI